MIGCEQGILERLSRSQAGMGRGSPLFKSNTNMYKGDYCMSLRPLCKTVVCKHGCLQMIASFFIFAQQLNVFRITLVANEAVHWSTGWKVKIRLPLAGSDNCWLCVVTLLMQSSALFTRVPTTWEYKNAKLDGPAVSAYTCWTMIVPSLLGWVVNWKVNWHCMLIRKYNVYVTAKEKGTEKYDVLLWWLIVSLCSLFLTNSSSHSFQLINHLSPSYCLPSTLSIFSSPPWHVFFFMSLPSLSFFCRVSCRGAVEEECVWGGPAVWEELPGHLFASH